VTRSRSWALLTRRAAVDLVRGRIISVFIYTYTYVYTYSCRTHTRADTHTNPHKPTCTDTHADTHKHTHMCRHTRVPPPPPPHTHTLTRAHTRQLRAAKWNLQQIATQQAQDSRVSATWLQIYQVGMPQASVVLSSSQFSL